MGEKKLPLVGRFQRWCERHLGQMRLPFPELVEPSKPPKKTKPKPVSRETA